MNKYIFFSIFIIFFSCENFIVDSDPPDTYRNNFELLWKDYDMNYPSFGLKEIYWDSIYKESIKELKNIKTDEEFHTFLSNILLNFKDGHVGLRSNFGEVVFVNSNNITENEPLNAEFYVSNFKKNSKINYGIIDGKDIGYLRIKSFSGIFDKDFLNLLENILNEFATKKGIILDIRSNGGGSTVNALEVASRLISKSSCFIKYKYRYDSNRKNLTDGISVIIEPKDEAILEKKIVILTNRKTASASEYFTQSLMNYPNVTIVGDTTSGAIGIPIWRELPIGWKYRLPINLAETCDEYTFEDSGIPPDIAIWNSRTNTNNKIDLILEKAVSIIK